jgi:hypothetical protein
MRIAVASACLLLALATPADAKDAEARLRAPVPFDAQPGTPITISWALVAPEDGTPFNACGVFVQLRGTTGAPPTRAYADGGTCRGHMAGLYEATVVVPDGGIAQIEVGLSGTTDIFFPVVPYLIPRAHAAPVKDEPPVAATLVAIAALVLAAWIVTVRRTTVTI